MEKKKRDKFAENLSLSFVSFISESPYLNYHVQVQFLIPSSANRQIRQCQPG